MNRLWLVLIPLALMLSLLGLPSSATETTGVAMIQPAAKANFKPGRLKITTSSKALLDLRLVPEAGKTVRVKLRGSRTISLAPGLYTAIEGSAKKGLVPVASPTRIQVTSGKVSQIRIKAVKNQGNVNISFQGTPDGTQPEITLRQGKRTFTFSPKNSKKRLPGGSYLVEAPTALSLSNGTAVLPLPDALTISVRPGGNSTLTVNFTPPTNMKSVVATEASRPTVSEGSSEWPDTVVATVKGVTPGDAVFFPATDALPNGWFGLALEVAGDRVTVIEVPPLVVFPSLDLDVKLNASDVLTFIAERAISDKLRTKGTQTVDRKMGCEGAIRDSAVVPSYKFASRRAVLKAEGEIVGVRFIRFLPVPNVRVTVNDAELSFDLGVAISSLRLGAIQYECSVTVPPISIYAGMGVFVFVEVGGSASLEIESKVVSSGFAPAAGAALGVKYSSAQGLTPVFIPTIQPNLQGPKIRLASTQIAVGGTITTGLSVGPRNVEKLLKVALQLTGSLDVTFINDDMFSADCTWDTDIDPQLEFAIVAEALSGALGGTLYKKNLLQEYDDVQDEVIGKC